MTTTSPSGSARTGPAGGGSAASATTTGSTFVRADGARTRTLTPALPRTWDADASWQPLCTRRGGSGRDTLTGTPGRDLLCGLGRSDRIAGDAGSDRLSAADGNDRFFARDGEFDMVGCGPGRDVVVADGRDLVGVDCEVVRRTSRARSAALR